MTSLNTAPIAPAVPGPRPGKGNDPDRGVDVRLARVDAPPSVAESSTRSRERSSSRTFASAATARSALTPAALSRPRAKSQYSKIRHDHASSDSASSTRRSAKSYFFSSNAASAAT